MRAEVLSAEPVIRPAAESEAADLTELALRSKGHWGYDAEFLAACRAELTLTPAYIETHPVFVLEDGESLVGFYSLERLSESEAELVHLFVEPAAIGRGFGKLLWRHAVLIARQHGFQELVITSDPQAEEFYRAMGASRVGVVPSGVLAGRLLPLMRFKLPLSITSVL